jgi:acyl carrier protein
MAAEPAALDHTGRRAGLVCQLRELAPDFTGDVADDTPLADGGLGLDSLSLIDLVAAMESDLGVLVSESDITEEHFATVARVLRLLDARSPRATSRTQAR